MKDEYELLGLGIYTVPEASLLVGISSGRIRRWLCGYNFQNKEGTSTTPLLVNSDLQVIDDVLALSFFDMIEMRFVDAFRNRGVSWNTIKIARERAKVLVDQSHPFITKSFKTDGRDIFAEVFHETGERALLDLVKNQYAFRQIISAELYKGLDFSIDDHLLRWWPGGNKRIVLDPERSFGKPIVDAEGVPTSVLADSYKVEESYQVVAKWYDVSVKSVKAAVGFERKLAA